MSEPQTNTNPSTNFDAVTAAQVTIGNIPDLIPDAIWTPGNDDQHITTDYAINSKLEYPKHTLMLPIASPNGFKGKSAVFVQVAAPTLKWIVDWTACSTLKQPDVPSPYVTRDKNWVLLGVTLEPAVIAAMADGQVPIYRLSGTYVYGHKKPKPTSPFSHAWFGRPPYIDNVVDRTVPLQRLKPLLMDY